MSLQSSQKHWVPVGVGVGKGGGTSRQTVRHAIPGQMGGFRQARIYILPRSHVHLKRQHEPATASEHTSSDGVLLPGEASSLVSRPAET